MFFSVAQNKPEWAISKRLSHPSYSSPKSSGTKKLECVLLEKEITPAYSGLGSSMNKSIFIALTLYVNIIKHFLLLSLVQYYSWIHFKC
jgi:hypothetical protein